MIGKLKGIIDSVAEDHLILDVGGVGYVVFASRRVLAVCEIGAAMSLMIETHVREDHIHLYGFASVSERECFKMLTTVQGVGARMGLAILGQFDAAQLQTIIAAQDKAMLTSISGVGPKLAERLLSELKNKVAHLSVGAAVMSIDSAPAPAATSKSKKATAAKAEPVNTDAADAVSALVNLGYGRAEAFSAVARAQSEGESGIDALIKAGLRELAA
jgi:holliday junction DNA helicase RuvA